MRRDIPRVGHKEFASLGRNTAQGIRSFCHHVFPTGFRIVEHHSPIGRVLVGEDEECFVDIFNHLKAVVRHLGHNRSEGCLLPGEVVEEQGVAILALPAL